MRTVAKTPKTEAACVSAQTAQNFNRQKQHYHNKLFPSRANRNISTQTQRRQYQEVANQWFGSLLREAKDKARAKGNPKYFHYLEDLLRLSCAVGGK